MIGHDAIRGRLRSLEDITGPVMFRGPDGVGKRTFALDLCRPIHATLLRVLDNPSVEQVRELNTWVLWKALGMKAAIIETTRSSIEAQNALLKLLEEPPPKLKLFVISASDRVLKTITSRCMGYWFAPLTRDQVILVLESLGFAHLQACSAAEYSDGSVAKALAYADAEAIYFAVTSVLQRKTAGDQAELVLKFKEPVTVSILLDELARRQEVRPLLIKLATADAGVRARLMLILMTRKTDSEPASIS